MMMVGYAAQKGLIPVSIDAIEKSIELNGVAVDMNKKALCLGRLLALDVKAVDHLLPQAGVGSAFDHRRLSKTLDETIERRVAFLTAYQNAAYGERYRKTMHHVRAVEDRVVGKAGRLSEMVAKNLYHLMAIKDEYEVARLYSAPSFKAQLGETFSDYAKIRVHLAPPFLAKRDPITGEPRKIAFGPWVLTLFPVLAAMKILRGTMFDVFGHTEERQRERQWLLDYEGTLDDVLSQLTPENFERAVTLLSVPQEIKGFGHVREKAMKAAAQKMNGLKNAFAAPSSAMAAE
jgi:indolepyruvate ferredoxin oxidoreductase